MPAERKSTMAKKASKALGSHKRRKLSNKEEKNTPESEKDPMQENAAKGSNEETAHMRPVDASANQDDDETEAEYSAQADTLTQQNTGPTQSDGRYRNKQRCLTLCSRGVTARYRHLLEDLRTLMPHHKKDSKLDTGDEALGSAINSIAEMKSCSTVLFLECRKRQDAYLWMSRIGDGANGQPGPCVKFHVTNVHTMDELRLTGNCMKGSRPILSFDESFNRLGHCKLMKELFIDVFGTPRGHPKSKPFVDRVMAFYYADKRVSLKLSTSSYLFLVTGWLSMITKMMSVCRTERNENTHQNRLRWNEATSERWALIATPAGPIYLLTSSSLKIFIYRFGFETIKFWRISQRMRWKPIKLRKHWVKQRQLLWLRSDRALF